MGRPLYSSSFSSSITTATSQQHTQPEPAVVVRAEPEQVPDHPSIRTWSYWNAFDPDADEFFESADAVYEAFTDPSSLPPLREEGDMPPGLATPSSSSDDESESSGNVSSEEAHGGRVTPRRPRRSGSVLMEEDDDIDVVPPFPPFEVTQHTENRPAATTVSLDFHSPPSERVGDLAARAIRAARPTFTGSWPMVERFPPPMNVHLFHGNPLLSVGHVQSSRAYIAPQAPIVVSTVRG